MLNLLTQKRCLILFSDVGEAERHFLEFEEITFFHKEKSVRSFFLPSSVHSLPEESRKLERSRILGKLTSGVQSILIFTDIQALFDSYPSPEKIQKEKFIIEKGNTLSQDFFCNYLQEVGFTEKETVYGPGVFARRGSIVDVFSMASQKPLRIVWWGDTVEDIREFDPESQISEQSLMLAEILPDTHQEAEQNVLLTEFFDLKNDLLVVFEPASVFDIIQSEIKSDKIFHELKKFDKSIFVGHHEMQAETIELNTSPQPVFQKKFDLFKKHLMDLIDAGYWNYFLSMNPRQYERLIAILDDFQIAGREKVPSHELISFLPIQVQEGFICHNTRLAFFSDYSVFGKVFHKEISDPLKGGRKKNILNSLSGLNPGDYVVHIDHGIGRYGGLEKINLNGKIQEAIRLVYKNNDILYVGVHQLHKISKYVGKEGSPPNLDRLGSANWEKVKQKAKRQIKELSYDLIKLYAKRKSSKGFAFQPDNYLELELEASFEFEDTPDQLKVTREVKSDMMSDYPMDRLVCGDVGFGKTEIAIRAAFKAVCSGKQVAVLVPTTILAYQHYQTFSRRLKEFPCIVDFISRFKTAKEIKKTLAALKEGKTDIIIGTHRLISKDVEFKDLGLLIIDEEQKFGVAAKDKIKLLKENIDTLTLTATPIPRTLQHSLLGSRDLSIINTPPPNRLPVHTRLLVYDEDAIAEAIRKEIQRGGQVYFIHHRVNDLQDLALKFKNKIPEMQISVAHGQMKADELEKELLRFVEGKSDILFCTTIIENGIDISNANTIIINNAHFFGLSDLHQMRGRVGRSDKKAYCLLVVPFLHGLPSEAQKRLQALVEFSDLGSGFQIALRDLDIRGAGNLLGAEQSGFIYEMGLETYMKILNEAIRELKEENPGNPEMTSLQHALPDEDITIETDLEARIPDSYIPDMHERMAIYRRLNQIKEEAEWTQVEAELKDRFGPLPKQVTDFIALIKFKHLAFQLGFDKIYLKNKQLKGRIPGGESRKAYFESEPFEKILQYIQSHPQQCRLMSDEKFVFLQISGVYGFEDALNIMNSIMVANHLTEHDKSH
ncbi:MAG: transcription-repair coupling factor [Bacteroidia bacterium]|nr:transcription-repair coupling factor [Bacteroidia bacterium]